MTKTTHCIPLHCSFVFFNKYELFANTINDSFQFRVKAIFEANRGLSRAITLAANEVCLVSLYRLNMMMLSVQLSNKILTLVYPFAHLNSIMRRFPFMPFIILKREHMRHEN
jgi:hypothetical protein